MNSQDSLIAQILRVVVLAEKAGEYDAADWIKSRMANEQEYLYGKRG